jgi:hypothetical protein
MKTNTSVARNGTLCRRLRTPPSDGCFWVMHNQSWAAYLRSFTSCDQDASGRYYRQTRSNSRLVTTGQFTHRAVLPDLCLSPSGRKTGYCPKSRLHVQVMRRAFMRTNEERLWSLCVHGTVHRHLMGEPNRLSALYRQVKERLSKQNPRIALFESRYVLQHSYTCCNTQCLPETRERKGESK